MGEREHGARRWVAVTVSMIVVAVLAAACTSSSGDQATPIAANDGSVVGTVVGGSVPRRAPTPGPVPTITGPLSGSPGASAAPPGLLAAHGYVEEEFLMDGTATSYRPAGPWGDDGVWPAEPAGTAPYSTRVLVRRPADPAKFNGKVLVEWLNVSSLVDITVDFGYLNVELMDQGYAYVGVSAQKIGLDSTKQADPGRYPTLVHPGDEYSYDLFTQAGRAVLAGRLLPAGSTVDQVIADGESQSAGRMTTYIDAVQPLVDLYDGFLVHSRSDRMTPLQAGQPAVDGARIRTDLRSPTLVVLTETDVLGNQRSAQPDGDRYRRWEIAGTAHVDNYDLAVLASQDPHHPASPGTVCERPINTAQQWWVMNAGLRHLSSWIAGGPPPPTAARMEVGADGQYVVDEHGNAKGGVRMADIDVPVARQQGLGNSPSWCRLFGMTTSFDEATIRQLYPVHQDYVDAFGRALDRMRDAGFVLERDAATARADAELAPVP